MGIRLAGPPRRPLARLGAGPARLGAGLARLGAGWSPRVRRAVLAVAAVVLVVVTAGVGYRVLAPAETLSAATSPYPDAAEPAVSRRYGNLAAAPLILDGRLRVYAEKRRLWADTPVTARLL